MARASRLARPRPSLSARIVGRATQTRRAGAGLGARAATLADGRAVLGTRCDHARAAVAGFAEARRGAAYERAAGDARPRRSACALRHGLSPLARAQGADRRAICGADSASARHHQGAHPSGIRAAPRAHLAEPLARSRRRAGKGRSMGRIFDRPLTRQLIGLAVLLIVWQWAADAGWLNPLYMPSPVKIWSALVQLFG